MLLDDRLDGLAGGRGPAAEDRGDAVLGEQLLGLLREGRPVGGAVFLDVLDLLAEDAAVGVDLVGGHVQHVGDGLLRDRHAAGEGVEEAELDRVAGGVDAALGCRGAGFGRRRVVAGAGAAAGEHEGRGRREGGNGQQAARPSSPCRFHVDLRFCVMQGDAFSGGVVRPAGTPNDAVAPARFRARRKEGVPRSGGTG